jgi:hypothetical protein
MSKTKKILLGLLLLAAFTHKRASGDTLPIVPVRTTWYVGKIGEKRQIELELHVPISGGISLWDAIANSDQQKQKITGSFFDDAIGQRSDLSGAIQSGALNLQQQPQPGKIAGCFTGDLYPNEDHASLTWSSGDGTPGLPVTLRRIADDTSLTFTQGDAVTISYHRPKFLSSAPLAKAVENQLRSEVAKEFESESNFPGDAAPKLGGDDLEFRDEKLVNTTIAYYSDSLISLRIQTYSDGGGAHGNEWFEARNFVLRQGKLRELKLHDLFLPDSDYLSRLSSPCLSALRERGASFVVNGSVKTLKSDDLKAFILGPRGITITFSPYVVASFAEGAFDVTIPWRMLSDIVASDPLLARWTAAQKSSGDERNTVPSVAQYDNNL